MATLLVPFTLSNPKKLVDYHYRREQDLVTTFFKFGATYKFVENYTFIDTLWFSKANFGRSSRSVVLLSETTGEAYNCFWNFFEECLLRKQFSNKWTFCKKGSNYSIKPLWEVLV